MDALEVMSVTNAEASNLFSLLSGVLHLGQVKSFNPSRRSCLMVLFLFNSMCWDANGGVGGAHGAVAGDCCDARSLSPFLGVALVPLVLLRPRSYVAEVSSLDRSLSPVLLTARLLILNFRMYFSELRPGRQQRERPRAASRAARAPGHGCMRPVGIGRDARGHGAGPTGVLGLQEREPPREDDERVAVADRSSR